MSESKLGSRMILTPMFRMSYPNLVTPRAYEDQRTKKKGEPTYGVDQIHDEENLTKFRMLDGNGELIEVDIRKVCQECANEMWPGIKLAELFPNGVGWPIKSGDAAAENLRKKGKSEDVVQAVLGKKVIKSGSKQDYPPNLSVQDGKGHVKLNRGMETDMKRASSLFTGGSYAMAECTVKAGETPQGKYVKFYLNGVRWLKAGDRIGSKGLMDRFDGIHGGAAAHDPTNGADLDDEIPF